MSQTETPESESVDSEESSFVEERESVFERAIAFILCLVALILPMIIIENGYDEFTAQHGEAREGAAGAGLALAVVFRTVSRTVLRTIVRTSARAGVRASLKGAMKNVARTAIRSQTSHLLKKGLDEKQKENNRSNIKSLFFGSGLLYVSWLIVIGLGQPYKDLLNKEDSMAQAKQEQEEEEALRLKMAKPAIEAWKKQKIFEKEQTKLENLRVARKSERDAVKQRKIASEIELQKLAVTQANFEFNQAYQVSKERVMDPNAHLEREEQEPTALEEFINYLMTYAPYPAEPKVGTIVQVELSDILLEEEEKKEQPLKEEPLEEKNEIKEDKKDVPEEKVEEKKEEKEEKPLQEKKLPFDEEVRERLEVLEATVSELTKEEEIVSPPEEQSEASKEKQEEKVEKKEEPKKEEIEEKKKIEEKKTKRIEKLLISVEITDSAAIEKNHIEIEKVGQGYQIKDNNTTLKLGWNSLRNGLHLQFPDKVLSAENIEVEGANVALQSQTQKDNKLTVKFNGRTSLTSPIIWGGGIVMFLPLWFMFFFQDRMAKRLGTVINHETEWIGGGIQLYFAAAFSFMPLTSDVMADTTVKKRGLIALAGLIPPTLVAAILWYIWKQTGNKMVLFVSDAFLIFPMVQIFPLDPLEGIHLWRWKKSGWLLSFFLIMGMFLFAGSEALKNVI